MQIRGTGAAGRRPSAAALRPLFLFVVLIRIRTAPGARVRVYVLGRLIGHGSGPRSRR